MDEPPTTRRPLERNVQREETRRSVRQTLANLPASYCQALVLRELNGLSYEEMARALECSYENARQLVHRARLRFRELHGLKAVAAGTACRELGDLLSAYHDGEIAPADRRAVRAHLASCRECRETHGDIRKMAALLAALPPIIPTPAWKSSVLGRIGAPPTPPPPPAAAPGAWSIAAFAAPALALVAAAILIVRARFPEAPPVPSSPTASVTLARALATLAPSAPALSQTPMLSATGVPSPIVEATTPALGPPVLTARQDSNCRSGPGTVYDVISYVQGGDRSPIDGRNGAATWWRIPRGDGVGHCWVWDGNVTVEGDTSAVPVLPNPPTPTPVDGIAPTISVAHMPAIPNDQQVITFTASASDNLAVARIEIWLRAPGEPAPTLRRTCSATNVCTAALGPLPAGQGAYFARAWDSAGNLGESSIATLTVVFWLQ
jgi:hypothetical protein